MVSKLRQFLDYFINNCVSEILGLDQLEFNLRPLAELNRYSYGRQLNNAIDRLIYVINNSSKVNVTFSANFVEHLKKITNLDYFDNFTKQYEQLVYSKIKKLNH